MSVMQRRIISGLLSLVLICGLASVAAAKTVSQTIAAPAPAATVFTVAAGEKKIEYTWADLTGASGRFVALSQNYSAKDENDELIVGGTPWSGVPLPALLADAERRLGCTFSGDYKIKAVAVDNYAAVFTVADAFDEELRYLLAADPVSNSDEESGEVYPESYLRLVRGTPEEYPNACHIRCLSGIVVLNSDGSALTAEQTTGGAAPHFTDLSGYTWAKAAIARLYAQEVIHGANAAATIYSPASSIRRSDFMLMLVRAYDFTAEADGNFTDVPQNSYYYHAIAVAKALGIAQGDNGKFNPRGYLTREDGMVLLYRAMTVSGVVLAQGGGLDGFSDAGQVADYASGPLSMLNAVGVVTGVNGKLLPKSPLSRAEMAVLLDRALRIMDNDNEDNE